MIALLGRSALYFTGEEFFERGGEHYRKLDARQKTRRTVGFSYIPDPQEVCNVRIWHAHFINGVLQWIFDAAFEIGVGSGSAQAPTRRP
jgi:hypothetical protein